LDARNWRCPRAARLRYPLVCNAGIIGEFVPGGNAMVVVEFVSLIHAGKCQLCRIPPLKPMFTVNGIEGVNVV
jgi:hypothetical protein